MVAGDGWDAEKMLDLYLHDYLVKRKMHNTAAIFRKEADVATNPVVIDPPDGFLHEWWTMFYDVYASRQPKDQKAKAKTPVQAEQMTQNELQNALPVVAKSPVNQQMTVQFPIGTNFEQRLGQPAASLLAARKEKPQFGQFVGNFDPNLHLLDVSKMNLSNSDATSSSSLLQQIYNQAQQSVVRDNRNGISIGGANPIGSTPYGVQKGIFPVTRSHDAGLNVTSNGSALNDLLLNLLTQSLKPSLQFPMLTEQNQQILLDQALPFSSANLTSAFPGNSANFDGRNMMHKKRNLKGKNAMMMVQMKQAEEQQYPHEQYLKQNSFEIGRKRNRLSYSRTGDKTMDCPNAEADKPVDQNVESFLSNDDNDNAKPFSTLKQRSTTCTKNDRFSFEEVGCLHSSKSKVLCCHFSSDGKILASAGQDTKVLVWNMGTFDFTKSSEGHSLTVTDVRFRPSSTIFATCSFDRTVQIWNAAKPSKSLFRLIGHSEQVMSLDFHSRKVDLLCSCDGSDQIRLWNVNQCACTRVFKGANKQVRFQPQGGKLLAAASGNCINVIDIDIGCIQFNLKGHSKEVLSVCWDTSGKYIASVSEDSARIWSLVLGGNCIYELHSNGSKFRSCTFHPAYSQLLVIGGYKLLEFWNPTESDKMWSAPAHKGLISALANSLETQMIASASHDPCVKIWK